MTISNPYSPAFFDSLAQGSLASARRVVPFLLELIHPKSVVDVGCGTGSWLAAFQECGIKDILGIDGDYVDRRKLLIQSDHFQAHNLAEPWNSRSRFDLAISLEVGEHLPDSSARTLVQSLVRLAPVVVFSAAVPGQGGVAHINEQWPDYWAKRFSEYKYQVFDAIRPRIWGDPSIAWYYRQNTLIYVHSDALPHYSELAQYQASCSRPLAMVHPDMYAGLLYNTRSENIPLRQALYSFVRTCRATLRRKILRLRRTSPN